MSYYRMLHTSFWTDSKVSNDFTPEDRYFYMYLLTNPSMNLSGCYEISVRKMAFETGYSSETVNKLLSRMEDVHKVISYSRETNEILLFNFKKYNWTKSQKYLIGLRSHIDNVKYGPFKVYLEKSFEAFLADDDISLIPYPYPTDTVSIPYGYNYSIPNIEKPCNTVLPDNLSDTPKVTTNKPDTTKKPSKKSDKPEVYDFKKHSNTENLSYFLDTTDKDYSAITDNPVIVEAVDLWLNYKTEEDKFTYTRPGLQSTLSMICSNIKKHGAEAVAYAIQMSISKTYHGIIFDLIPGRKEGNNGFGGNQRGGYKTKLQMQQEDMQQTYDLAREFANSGGIIDD